MEKRFGPCCRIHSEQPEMVGDCRTGFEPRQAEAQAGRLRSHHSAWVRQSARITRSLSISPICLISLVCFELGMALVRRLSERECFSGCQHCEGRESIFGWIDLRSPRPQWREVQPPAMCFVQVMVCTQGYPKGKVMPVIECEGRGLPDKPGDYTVAAIWSAKSSADLEPPSNCQFSLRPSALDISMPWFAWLRSRFHVIADPKLLPRREMRPCRATS
jgi:hypothetical protein